MSLPAAEAERARVEHSKLRGFFLVELVPILAILAGALAFASLGRRGERRAEVATA